MGAQTRALAWLAATLLAASLVVFLVLDVLPGDPAAIMLGMDAEPSALAALHHRLGFDLPLATRYLRWVGALLTGDLGVSTSYDIPVSQLLGNRLAVTLPLTLLALLLSVLLGIPLGVMGAAWRGRAAGTALDALTQLGQAIPDFWLGVLLILIVALHGHLLPASGFPGWAHPLAGLAALLLPALAIALPQGAVLARVMRGSVLSVQDEEFMRTARGKGLSRRAALWRHAVPNALIPTVTIVGMQFSFLVAGTIVVENVFSLPGVGRLVYQAVAQRDLIVVQDLVILFVAVVIMVNFAVERLYGRLDPRLADAAVRRGG